MQTPTYIVLSVLMINKDDAFSRDIQLICADCRFDVAAKYVVPTGRVVVPTGRYVVPAGTVPAGKVILSPGRVK
ncbi:hypothetical protein Tco_1151765 [Tanacetum coccineum]